MKIVINKDQLVLDDEIAKFNKVRIVVENNKGEILLTKEDGKVIFPGGKIKEKESPIQSILRELEEEAGIKLDAKDLKEEIELETYYKDFYNFRSNSKENRYTKTIYYSAKTNKNINIDNQQLTTGELKQNFEINFFSREAAIKILNSDHSSSINGKFFDEENRIVVENILNKE